MVPCGLQVDQVETLLRIHPMELIGPHLDLEVL
jgi:hypothetical protein